MADKAHIAVDKKLAVMGRRISAIYSEAQADLQKKADKYFKQFEEADQKKRKLVEQGKLTEDEYKKWRKGKIARGKQFAAMKEQVAENLLHTNEIAIAYINGEIPDVYTLGYNALAPTVEGVGGYSFSLVDADTVRNLATTDTSLLPYKKLNPAKDIAWNMQKINAQVAQGILQGESIPKIAKRISNVQEMNRTSAIRTARTIVTGAENKGRMDSYKRAEADGIILQKEWLSSNQPGRTRDWHFPNSFDKLTVDTDQPFINGMGEIMFPGDHSAKPANVYNCRCSMRAIVKGFNKVQVQKATEKSENQERIRRRREEYFARKQQASEPDFENMTRAQLDKYVSENISAKFGDVSGVNTDFYRKTVKAVKRVESKYGKIEGLRIEFGGVRQTDYAHYDPTTKTLHLKKKGSLSQFAESIAKADERAMRKYGIKYSAESSYEGTVFHELAHAIDHDTGYGISKALGATEDILTKSRKISFYSRSQGSIAMPKASEATAENISSYFMGNTDKIDKDVLTIIEEYFKRKKK